MLKTNMYKFTNSTDLNQVTSFHLSADLHSNQAIPTQRPILTKHKVINPIPVFRILW